MQRLHNERERNAIFAERKLYKSFSYGENARQLVLVITPI